MIYLDNAATSYPKPPQVIEAVVRYLENAGSPARSSHRMALTASQIINGTRETLAQLIGLDDPTRVIFTANATTAINFALQGILSPGDHVITTSIEHNSVMRPLRALEKQGVHLTIVSCSSDGLIDPEAIQKAIRPTTTMVVVAHASNVLGSILPIRDIGTICRSNGLLFLLDAAQTIGTLPLNMIEDCIDLLAFSGHKSLYGPQGTGGLAIAPHVSARRIRPLIHGGTGSRSESEHQPDFLPDLGESGTANGPGLAGLAAGIDFVLATGIDTIRQHEIALTSHLTEGLLDIPCITLYGPTNPEARIGLVSFNISGLDPASTAFILDEKYDIMCRAGLHCAPSAHKTAGSFPDGSIRFSFGIFQTIDDINAALDAVRSIVRKA